MKRLLFVHLFCLAALVNTKAAEEKIIAGLSGSQIVANAQTNVSDQWYPQLVNGQTAGIFSVNSSTVSVIFHYDQSEKVHFSTPWDITVNYDITLFDASGTTTLISGQQITITYDPVTSYNDKVIRDYKNAHRAILKINSVTQNGITDFTEDIRLDLENTVDRNYIFDVSHKPLVKAEYSSIDNMLQLDWEYVQGAESYEVEWLFVDIGNQLFSTPFDFDIKNATRISTTQQTYNITMAYPKGILIFRVRGVKETNGARVYGSWSYTPLATDQTDDVPVVTILGSNYPQKFEYNGMSPELNWNYQAAYSEEGKRMEGISFFDGLMRNRQSVVVNQSEERALAGQTIYDFVGRPAIQVMPSPMTWEGVGYYENLSKDANNTFYDFTNFDADGQVADPLNATNSTGAGKYYSNQNTSDPGFLSGYIPDAEGYPFVRIKYKNDGTGRIISQSGVGEEFKDGSQHSTFYTYGTPGSQQELDRLFGNEAGPVGQYSKMVVTDPNGQSSVTYIDNEGRVIATALAGNEPANLHAIDTKPGTGTEISSNLTQYNILSNNQWVISNTFTVSSAGAYDFQYALSPDQYCSDCLDDDAQTTLINESCTECRYDLKIKLIDEQTGAELYTYSVSNIAAVSNYHTFSVQINAPGAYTIVKILSPNQQAIDDAIAYFKQNQQCITPAIPDPADCNPDCASQCLDHYTFINNLGNTVYTDDNGVVIAEVNAQNTVIFGDLAAAQLLITNCTNACNAAAPASDFVTPCETKLFSLSLDMQPGGQYFDNLPQSGQPGYDINGWLDANYPVNLFLTALGASAYSPCNACNDWSDVRAQWNTDWVNISVEGHPEWCDYEKMCIIDCRVENIDFTTASLNSFYELMYTVAPEPDASDPAEELFNPTNIASNNVASSYGYQPFNANPVSTQDPYFICNSTIKFIIDDHLLKYVPKVANPGPADYYSVWYIMNDPQGIAGANGGNTSGVLQEVVDLMNALHGDGINPGLIGNGTGQISKYKFFRGVYDFFRQRVIYQQTKFSCGPYLVSPGNTGFTADGFNIHFPENPIYDNWPITPADVDMIAVQQASSVCEQYADDWMASLTCTLSTNDAADVREYLIAICANGFSADYPAGSDDVSTGNNQPVSIPTATFPGPFTTFAGVLTAYGCNVIQHPAETSAPFQQATCNCDQFHDFLVQNNFPETNPNSTDLQNIYDYLVNNDYLATGESITTTNIQSWYNECAEATPSVTDLDNAAFLYVFKCNTEPGSTANAYLDECAADLNNLNLQLAQQQHQEAVNNAAQLYAEQLRQKCLDPTLLLQREHFKMVYTLNEYHYTLFYYNQAGNLVRTVPPKGVDILDTELGDVALYRQFGDDLLNAPNGFIHPAHTYVTHYKYNSLQNPVEQTTPDGATTRFYYDYLDRIVASQNERQLNESTPRYSYTLYDALGRMTEAGELASNTALTNEISRDPAQLANWLNGATGKFEVTRVTYDYVYSNTVSSYFGLNGQQNLRNRISSSVYFENEQVNPANYDFATHYSYDIHGNVQTLIQEIPELAPLGQHLKITEYKYDLVSGNVNEVHYQNGKFDEFHHRYFYDADNRLKEVFTSRDGRVWERDADYFYYAHGPLARTELGDKQVNADDHIYTLQGWLKGVNSNTLQRDRDPGKDGEIATLNDFFAGDARGFTLGYYQGDYKSVTQQQFFEAGHSQNALFTKTKSNLFNGNIGHMVTTLSDLTNSALPQAMVYEYDQLNRIKAAEANTVDLDVLGNKWSSTHVAENKYKESDITYDGNGNILTYRRNGNDAGNPDMDVFTYNYTAGTNQLEFVADAGNTFYTTDLKNQSAGNYDYDGSGRLIKDNAEKISVIKWNAQNKVRKIKRSAGTINGSYPDELEYKYNALSQRTVKIVKHRPAGVLDDQSKWQYQYYITDVTGNVMAIYQRTFANTGGNSYLDHFKITEHPIYGSSRLGMNLNDKTISTPFTANLNPDDEGQMVFKSIVYGTVPNDDNGIDESAAIVSYTRTLGKKQYEQTNHLGNVLEVISDRKLTEETPGYVFEDYENQFIATAAITHVPGTWVIGSGVTYSFEDDGLGNIRLKVNETIQNNGIHRSFTVQPNTTYTLTFDAEYDAQNNTPTVRILDYDGVTETLRYFDFTTTGSNTIMFTTSNNPNVNSVRVKLNGSPVPSGFYIDNFSVTGNGLKENTNVLFLAQVENFSDYYPFGMEMTGRNGSIGQYRYGFNGKESESEVTNTESHYDFGARVYDSRIGRWASTEPLAEKYPAISPYAFVANMPTIATDPDGREIVVFGSTNFVTKIYTALYELTATEEGKRLYEALVSTNKRVVITAGLVDETIYKPGKNTILIKINPDLDNEYIAEDNATFPIFVTLGHEFRHAESAAYGFNQELTYITHGFDFVSSRKERDQKSLLHTEYDATVTENIIREQANLHVRETYGGKSVYNYKLSERRTLTVAMSDEDGMTRNYWAYHYVEDKTNSYARTRNIAEAPNKFEQSISITNYSWNWSKVVIKNRYGSTTSPNPTSSGTGRKGRGRGIKITF